MKCVLVSATGSVDCLQLHDVKFNLDMVIPPLFILIKTKYAGVNLIDMYHRSGICPINLPFVPGREGAGFVVRVGKGVMGFSPGDKVVWLNQGTYSEYVVVSSKCVMLIPAPCKMEVAVAALLQGLTAMCLTSLAYPLQKGDVCLILSASGGTGRWLVHMAASRGARVIAALSKSSKRRLIEENPQDPYSCLKKLGADYIISYKTNDPSFHHKVLEITQQKGVQAVYDGIGSASFDSSLKSLSRRGYLVSFGTTKIPMDVSILSKKNVYLTHPSLFEYLKDVDLQQYSSVVFSHVLSDAFQPKIHKIYPLSDVILAHEDLESRASGKILLQIL